MITQRVSELRSMFAKAFAGFSFGDDSEESSPSGDGQARDIHGDDARADDDVSEDVGGAPAHAFDDGDEIRDSDMVPQSSDGASSPDQAVR